MKLRGNLMRINKEKANKKVMREQALKMSEDIQQNVGKNNSCLRLIPKDLKKEAVLF